MNDNRKLFVPGTTIIRPGGSQAPGPVMRPGTIKPRSSSGGSGRRGGGGFGGIISGAVSNYARDPEFRAQVNAAVGGIAKKFQSDEPSGSNGGVLSPAPNPARTKLDTGIRQMALEKDYLTAEEGSCATMHTTHVVYSFPSNTGKVYDFFKNVSIVDTQSRAQDNVNWSIDVTNKFSATNLIAAFNDLFYCLQVYFFARSIDVYRDGAYNNNEGMHALRAQFDFNTIYKMDQVARLLVRTAIPPNMLEFCRYINSNYMSGDTPNCPIIKIIPITPGSTGSYLTNLNTALDSCISRLTSSTNREIFSVMNRALGHWVLGETNKLYDPPVETTYDKDFLTIFNNLPFRTGIANNIVAPVAADSATAIRYLTWTNKLDGIALGLTDIWDSVNLRFFGDTISIPNLSGNSRFSYYAVSGVKGFYPSIPNTFLRTSRIDTYISDAAILSTPHYYGSDMVLNINANTLAQSTLNTIDWWLSIDKIKNENVRHPSTTNYPSKKGRRR